MRQSLFIAFMFAAVFAGLPAHARGPQSATTNPLGALKNSIKVTGQIAGGQRRLAYKFTLSERACIRVSRVDTSVSLRAYLYDSAGGLLQKERLDPARDRSKFIQRTIFPGEYIVEVELFYSRDTAATYQLVIAKEAC